MAFSSNRSSTFIHSPLLTSAMMRVSFYQIIQARSCTFTMMTGVIQSLMTAVIPSTHFIQSFVHIHALPTPAHFRHDDGGLQQSDALRHFIKSFTHIHSLTPAHLCHDDGRLQQSDALRHFIHRRALLLVQSPEHTHSWKEMKEGNKGKN